MEPYAEVVTDSVNEVEAGVCEERSIKGRYWLKRCSRV